MHVHLRKNEKIEAETMQPIIEAVGCICVRIWSEYALIALYRSFVAAAKVMQKKSEKRKSKDKDNNETERKLDGRIEVVCLLFFIWSFASCVTSNNFIMCAVRQRCGVFINNTRQFSTLSNFTVKRSVQFSAGKF